MLGPIFCDFHKQSIPWIGKLGFRSQYYAICLKETTRGDRANIFYVSLSRKEGILHSKSLGRHPVLNF